MKISERDKSELLMMEAQFCETTSDQKEIFFYFTQSFTLTVPRTVSHYYSKYRAAYGMNILSQLSYIVYHHVLNECMND